MLKVIAAFLLVLTAPVLASADWGKTLQESWDKSKQYSQEAWDKTLDAWNSTSELFSESEETRRQSRTEQENERFREMWDKVFSQLEEGLKLVDEIKDAPESSLFREDKISLTEDLHVVLDKTIVLLEDESINDYRSRIETLNQLISKAKSNILAHREAKITAPRSHMVKTTKADYNEKIQDEQENIAAYRAEREKIKMHLQERLQDIGVVLTREQVSILLSRVDANDIIQMSVIFDVLKKITAQLMQLTRDSGEEITHAKKYYGMHLVLLEMVTYMQQKYIDTVDTVYLPGIDAIIKQTEAIRKTARKQVREDPDPKRVAIYKNNIAVQELTLKTARLYRDNLKDQQNKVKTALKVALKDLQLARNTYDTVEVSANLLAVLQTSNASFDALMNLQVPQIIPFENLQMQSKYQELSRLLKE